MCKFVKSRNHRRYFVSQSLTTGELNHLKVTNHRDDAISAVPYFLRLARINNFIK